MAEWLTRAGGAGEESAAGDPKGEERSDESRAPLIERAARCREFESDEMTSSGEMAEWLKARPC
jgi:hypothetical protein